MQIKKYMYNVNYPEYDEPLCAIEKRALFNEPLKGKVFFSSTQVDPSTSPYIKQRLELMITSTSFEDLLLTLKNKPLIRSIKTLKYIKLVSGDPYAETRKLLINRVMELVENDSGEKINDEIYGMTCYNETWYFGKLVKNSGLWRNHNKRPHTYSNSLKNNMAKVLINIAGNGDLSKRIIDPCCGAGTVLLEGCFAGYEMIGSDINEKMTTSASRNINFFGYQASITHQGVEMILDHYDAAIIDLPYGLYSQTTPELQRGIIRNAKRISDKVVVISSEDISSMLAEEKLKIIDSCEYIKSINRKFTRYIWVCI